MGHQDRRHPLQGRRPGGAGGGGERRADDALRRRQFPRPGAGRQGQGAGGRGGEALAVAARRADPRRGRLGGYPGQGWWGLAAPKGTPPAIVARLNTEFAGLFGDAKFVAFLDKQAVVSAPTTPEGFAAFLKEDRKAAETLIKIANTKKMEFKQQ